MSQDNETLELREGSFGGFSTEKSSLKFSGSSKRKQYLFVAFLVLMISVGLAVGLALGLRKCDNENNDGDSAADKGTIAPPTSHKPLTLTPPVLLISLDGFRASYLSYKVTPTLQQLIREGVHSPRLLSAYPSLTFPNHYTIVTGLYPESHGIIDNKMFDINFKRYYRLGSREASNPEWYGGEPIWLTAQKQGKRTASFFWVGSDVKIGGQYPNEYRKYDGSVSFSERVDTVLDWLSATNESRFDLVTLYFNEPDHTGHQMGPGPTTQMLDTLKMVDDTIKRLVDGLKNRNLYDDVNVIIVADHGMSSRSCQRQVVLADFFNATELSNMVTFTSASGRIANRYKKLSNDYILLDTPYVSKETILSKVSGHPHIAVYDKSHLPKRLHYANNIRIDDVVMKMDDEWVVSKGRSSGSSCSGGTHGWDTRYESMSGLFIARGPDFKEGLEIPPFENIELYDLVSDLLKITPAPNNGTRGSLYATLKNPPTLDQLRRPERQCVQMEQLSSQQMQTHCRCSSRQSRSLLFQPSPNGILHPVLVKNQSDQCFSDEHHTTVYSSRLHMPLWTSFTITNKEDIQQDAESCIVPNSQLTDEKERKLYTDYQNSTQGVDAAVMFATTSSCGSIAQSTDVIPMMKSLKKDLWQELWHMLRSVVNATYPAVSVTMGPVFDYNFDGLPDDISNLTRFVDSSSQVPLPSHYFVVLARCPQAGQELYQCAGDMDVLSFILPNQQNTNGQSKERRLLENVARVKDVELLTGLRFFPELQPMVSARLRTHVPMALWTTPLVWTDVDLCPAKPVGSQCTSSYQPLLLISLDGFRADYLVKYNRTPTIDRLINCGVHAPYMRSVYPTKTFPNHYTIVTGLYPESHGIVDNKMYDTNMSQRFCLSCKEAKNSAWWAGEPIWLTAKHHNLTTATYFWPGSDVAVHGEYPDFYKVYADGVSYSERVQQVLEWMKQPGTDRPDFLTLYFDEPDHTGHQTGPDSTQIGEKLAEVDAALSDLMQGLLKQDMLHCVNIMIIADHGMSGTSCERLIPLSADLSKESMDNMYVYDGPVGRISNRYKYDRNDYIPLQPPKINISTIVNKLECSEPHMRVYTKPSLPLRHHYTNNDRIDDILLDADDQWLISSSGSTRYCDGGNHGYDNLYASMHALFLAYGPVFKAGMEIEPFENIELYNLMADILGVSPAPNNGTEGSLFDVLITPPSLPSSVPTQPSSCGRDDSSTVRQQQIDPCTCSPSPLNNTSKWRSPLGDPVSSGARPWLCVKHRSDHTTAYDSNMTAPAWLTFSVHLTNSTLPVKHSSPCVVRDAWMMSDAPTLNATVLQGTDYVPASLLFVFNNSCDTAMASEVVPMLAEFKSGIWREVEQMVADYSVQHGEITVTVGPVYNDDATALWKGRTNKTRLAAHQFPVPTHFFVVLGKCGDGSQSLPCWETLQLMSFLIPHVPTPTNCQNFRSMLRENVARVRDVEIATGLQFFSQLSPIQAAKLRTFLPTYLWNGSAETDDIKKPGHWINQQCPPKGHADTQCPSNYQPVLLVSLDGFKPQYLGRGLTPVMDRLLQCGVHAPYMRSVYPTKTFPNHYTIATGLYPESHGIIDNNMFDFNIGDQRFSIFTDTKNNPSWWGGDPIWLTAQRQNLTSASFFWVGSDVPVQGSYPDIFKYYSGSVPYSTRVSTIVEWMRLPVDRRPDFLMLYFDEPDHQAHTSGPFTPEVDEELKRVDSVLGELMDNLYQSDLHHCVNLMLVSDHGFSSMSCDQVIEMNKYFNQTEKYDVYFYYGPFGRISNTYKRYRNGSVSLYKDQPPMSVHDVQNHLKCVDHLKVYAKTDLPVRHHYVNNHRIDNIILDPAINWTVSDKVNTRYCTGGSHGWDNTYKAMEALFVGYGPAFKNGETVEAFENIELYNMISDVLGIQPSPNNGTEGSLDHLLWQTFNRTRTPTAVYTTPPDDTISQVLACNCSSDTTQVSNSIIQALNSSSVPHTAMPFGAPLLMRRDMGNTSLLYQPSYITAYSIGHTLPLWVSTTLSPSKIKTNAGSNCVMADPRVSNTNQCHDSLLHSNVSMVSLLPSGYELDATASLVSSYIPMYHHFHTGVWQSLQSKLSKWSEGFQDLNVISGPVFDGNNDGLADTLNDIERLNMSVPSHVFMIASRCNSTGQSVTNCSSINTITFILPQVDTSMQYNCQSEDNYLVDNEARVRDVELITGLHFFPDLPYTQAVALRTYLPAGLWPV